MSKKRTTPRSGIALSLSLSEWSWRQLLASMKADFPRASSKEIQRHIREYLDRLEEVRQRMRFRVPR
jgi:hypothetical protein